MKTPLRFNVLAHLLGASLLGIALMAPPDTLKASEEILFPTQDAFIISGAADSKHNFNRLELAGRTLGVNRKVYLQFDLPPNAKQTKGARLMLTANGVIAGPSDPLDGGFPFKVFAALGDQSGLWDENSITWNNAPGNSGGPTVADLPWVEVGRMEVPLPLKNTEQTIEVNLTELPGLLKKGAGQNLTLILVPDVQDGRAPGVSFFSNQGTAKSDKRPSLILTD